MHLTVLPLKMEKQNYLNIFVDKIFVIYHIFQSKQKTQKKINLLFPKSILCRYTNLCTVHFHIP